MKFNFFKNILAALALVLVAGACSERDLDDVNKGVINNDTYYTNYDEAYAGLVAVYDVLRKNSGGFENMISMMNAGSDDNWAGGGSASDGAGIQGFSSFTINETTMPESFWSDHYKGVFRANILIEKLPAVNMPEADKARFTAEAKSLRALYYFNLVRMFKNIPLILAPVAPADMYNITQANPADVYAQMEKDLVEAIPNLPVKVTAAENGRLSRGAAKALLGKIYLYDNKKAQAAEQLAEVNGTPGGTSIYGYKLLTNFADLWVVDNKFHSEAIIEESHTNLSNSGWGNWGSSSDEGNSLNVMVGPRSYSRLTNDAPDIPSGWSFSIFTDNFFDFMKDDPRLDATVFNAKALKAAGKIDYVPGYQDTGYFLNKFLPRQSDVTTGGGDAVLNYRQDTYIIRLADTYLLEAEALNGTGVRAQALLDAVRARVGLAPVPVSMAAIKAERRRELAGEGHRFFDLVRWGDAATVLASKGFVAGKNEILPIPYRELINTQIKQNPNY